MANLLRVNGSTSNIIRVHIKDLSTPGAGKTGLAHDTASLVIGTIANNEATATAYTQAGSTIETISTLGTYAAPTATKCRFKEVDATNCPGLYEIHLADARFAVANAKSLLVYLSGAADMEVTIFEVDLAGTISSVAAIGTGGIVAASFAADSIVAATLATGAITADAFAADAIVAATLATGVLTADAFATDAIAADSVAAATVTKIQAGLATATALDTVDNFVDTEVGAIKTVTDKLATMYELDGAVYRFTENALEQGVKAIGSTAVDADRTIGPIPADFPRA